MTQDLHSHTYFSACGADDPELLILKAIESGIDVFGISDHNYGRTAASAGKISYRLPSAAAVLRGSRIRICFLIWNAKERIRKHILPGWRKTEFSGR